MKTLHDCINYYKVRLEHTTDEDTQDILRQIIHDLEYIFEQLSETEDPRLFKVCKDLYWRNDELNCENIRLKNELKETKKKKNKWKERYRNLRDGKVSIELSRIEDGLGIEPIKEIK
jgi:hypothetical protein